jgi:gamma-glutamyltranspeptidase/glutathione hydrolase
MLRSIARLGATLCTIGAVTARAQSDSSTPVVTAKNGMVVSVSAPASDIGAAILRKGGNAVDAAVATAFALAVTHPSAGNIGGGGFMIVRMAGAKAGALVAIDYRERAPFKATPAMYLDSASTIVRQLTATGYLSPGVPGTVRGLALAHKRYGKLRWTDVVMPAADLAERGFPVSEALARSLNHEVAGAMAPYAASVAAYGKPGGGQWAVGDTLALKDLARSLRAIATDGPNVFYTGWIADSIAKAMAENGGLITKKDLAAYAAEARISTSWAQCRRRPFTTRSKRCAGPISIVPAIWAIPIS